jgi:RHS repeat-associated protein
MISTTSSIQLLNYTPANRLKSNNYTRTVGAIITPTTTTIQTDAAGNILKDGAKNYTYNSLGRLKDFTLNSVVMQYKYDLQNRRIAKTYPASNTHDTYVYAEAIDNLNSTQLLGEYNSTGTKQEYIWLGNTPIAVVQNGIILTIHADHLNTPRQLTNTNKQVVWNWAYSAFGDNIPSSVGAIKFNLRYPGQYYDAESKLHYNINRYYEPATGRYTQSDPIGLNAGVNTYTYVGGNAVGGVDRLGLYIEVIIWNGVGKGSSQFGHVSTNINGQNWSWTPDGWDSKYHSAENYSAHQQSFRGGKGYILDLTPLEEAEVVACFKARSEDYNFIKNNCTTPSQECLPPRLRLPGGTWAPNGLGQDLENSPALIGTKIYQGPERTGAPFDNSALWGF